MTVQPQPFLTSGRRSFPLPSTAPYDSSFPGLRSHARTRQQARPPSQLLGTVDSGTSRSRRRRLSCSTMMVVTCLFHLISPRFTLSHPVSGFCLLNGNLRNLASRRGARRNMQL
ncbi:hypothetical protein OBBRIDRAFT_13679 [Obba rivulosa]|uniref:Uncharacterized protein n=1 Tax=Obba rivulosa TaxID=1052685 RepID=A0A8E2DW03_9APHY|nr:hypothetical protein OBBRIDRAFT_13679 [Obba rivulosa]